MPRSANSAPDSKVTLVFKRRDKLWRNVPASTICDEISNDKDDLYEIHPAKIRDLPLVRPSL